MFSLVRIYVLYSCERSEGWEMAVMKEEKRKELAKMKQKLWDWGQTMEKFSWMEDEIRKATGLQEMRRKVWDGKSEKEMQKMEQEYSVVVGRLRIGMVELLREQARMNGMIDRLTLEEKQFVRLRFENGYGFDYIGVKMHRSRATLFRLQDRVLERLMDFEKEYEST